MPKCGVWQCCWTILLLMLLNPILSYAKEVRVDIEITGVEKELLTNVQAYLSIVRQKDHPQLTARRIKRLHDQAPAEIRRALQPFGYYQPEISSELLPPENDATVWRARYQIEQGPPLKLEAVTINLQGAATDDPTMLTEVSVFPLKTGDTLNHASYEAGKRRLEGLAEERGYFGAEFTKNQILIDPQTYTARIEMAFESGARYCFGNVSFIQSEYRFDEGFLRNFMTFNTGDAYSAEALLAFHGRLAESDYFQNIEIETRRVSSEYGACVDLDVKLTARRRTFVTARMGFGTDTGVRVRLSGGYRRLNKYGHRLIGEIGATQTDRKYVARLDYLIPVGDINTDYWDITLRYEGEDRDESDLGIGGFDLEGDSTRVESLSFAVSRHRRRHLLGLDIDEAISLTYLLESFDLIELLFVDSEIQDVLRTRFEGELDILSPNYKVLMPGISWTYRDADNFLYITRGEMLRLRLRGAHESVGSNLSFVQVDARGYWIRELHDRGRIILRGEAGYTQAKTKEFLGREGAVLPESIQFATGGDRTIRGYGFEELTGENSLVRGRHIAVGSVEYEYRFLDKWGAAVFSDFGNVTNSFSDFDVKVSTGLGIRWHSPIGPVRIDFAKALNDPDADPWRFHLTIGPEF